GDLILKLDIEDYSNLGVAVNQDTFWLSAENASFLLPADQSQYSFISSICQTKSELTLERIVTPNTMVTMTPNENNSVLLNISPNTNLFDIVWEGDNLSCNECTS